MEQDLISNSITETLTDSGASLNTNIDEEPVQSKQNITTAIESDDSGVQHRRELLGSKLNNYKQEKLKRQLPVDSQMLNCAKEDVQYKKQLMEQIHHMDQLHNQHMS